MSISSLALFNVSVLQVHRMAASQHTILPWKTLASSWHHAKVGTSVGHRWILLLATDGYFNLATDTACRLSKDYSRIRSPGVSLAFRKTTLPVVDREDVGGP